MEPMSVGHKQAPELLRVLSQIGKIGDHQIHAVHLFIGKSHTAVDDDHILAVFQHRDILADLIQTAQRNNFQFFCQLIYTPFSFA